MTGYRVRRPSVRIDFDKPLSFSFDGQAYDGYAGDTLASALLANGVRMLGRSFKYGRPRGIVGAGPEEPNALMQVEAGALTIPNLKATQVELYDGLVATTHDRLANARIRSEKRRRQIFEVHAGGLLLQDFSKPNALAEVRAYHQASRRLRHGTFGTRP